MLDGNILVMVIMTSPSPSPIPNFLAKSSIKFQMLTLVPCDAVRLCDTTNVLQLFLRLCASLHWNPLRSKLESSLVDGCTERIMITMEDN